VNGEKLSARPTPGPGNPATGARCSARAANRPENPPLMMTTLPCPVAVHSAPRSRRLSGRVVPGIPFRQQAVGFLRSPAVPRVAVQRPHVAQYRIDTPPRGLDGVLPGKQPALAGQGRVDQPVVGADLATGLSGEGHFLELRPPFGPFSLADDGHSN